MGQEQPPGVLALIQESLRSQHIVCVSTQECGRSILKSMLVSGKDSWESNVQSTLGDKYMRVSSISENALHIAVYVRTSILSLVSKVETGREATGVAGIMYNKGGLSVGFHLQGRAFLFVNCHLASGQSGVSRRLKDFEQIERGLQLRQTSKYSDSHISNRFDCVFWSGDMNFRIEGSIEEVGGGLAAGEY